MIVLTRLLGPILQPGREQGITPDFWQPKHAAAYIANGLVIAVVAPIVEELTFRGLGYSLLARYGKWAAIVLTGLAFGLAHGLVAGASLPHGVRNGPRLSTQPSEKRLPRHDRPRPLQRGCADRFSCRKTTGGYSARVRCGLVCALALLTLFPAATGAAPLASIQTTPAAGAGTAARDLCGRRRRGFVSLGLRRRDGGRRTDGRAHVCGRSLDGDPHLPVGGRHDGNRDNLGHGVRAHLDGAEPGPLRPQGRPARSDRPRRAKPGGRARGPTREDRDHQDARRRHVSLFARASGLRAPTPQQASGRRPFRSHFASFRSSSPASPGAARAGAPTTSPPTSSRPLRERSPSRSRAGKT